jgi:hypothetical protein
MSYTNADGLRVLTFGAKGEVNPTGNTCDTVRRTLVVKLADASTLADVTIPDVTLDAYIPADSVVLQAWLVVDTAFAGATAVLDIGTFNSAGTAVDDDGIDAAIAMATLVDNLVVACNGAVIGTRVTADTYVGFSYDTAAFTAGAAVLYVEYLVAVV